MKDLSKYRGIFPAFYACYGDDGEVSPARVADLAHWLIGKGVQGVYACGSSGECIYQSVEDRKKTLEALMAVAKGKLVVIAHVAANNTRDSQELARHAASLGVDAIAAIPPIYFHLAPHAVQDYWTAISRAADGVDFIIYNIPQLSGTALTTDMIAQMRNNPNVVGVKNSSNYVLDICTFKKAGGENFVVFNGPDEQYVAGRLMGADGGIGGTYGAMPELFLKAEAYFAAGDTANAMALQYDIVDIINRMSGGQGHMYAIIKQVLRLQGLDIGGVRPPLPAVTQQDMALAEAIHKAIEAAKAKHL